MIAPKKKAVLLIQFGSPLTPLKEDIHTFLTSVLKEHLFPFLPQCVIHHCISPWLLQKTCNRYQKIWKEPDSPLIIHSINFTKKLALRLPSDTILSLGMLHGAHPLSEAVETLRHLPLEKLLVFPLFPLYTPLTTIVKNKCKNLLSNAPFPCEYIDSFHNSPFFIESCAKKIPLQKHDHLLFSFHALPFSSDIYKSACYETACLIANRANISQFSVSFQSKVGFGPWTTPSTKEVLQKLLQQGKKRILVMTPGFVVDCTETLTEIAIEYKEFFRKIGGEELTCVSCLNDFDPWVESTASFLRGFL